MTEPRYQTRRATVEDLPQLMDLWRLERLPAEALEKRFTEFQVVTDDAGQVLATLGLHIIGATGCLHGEAIGRPELSDPLRALIWKRLQVIIQNHALERLWTQLDGVFWRDCGFTPVPAEEAASRPAAFDAGEAPWHILTLRAAVAKAALDRDFAEIKALQAQETERLRVRVRWMKRVALGVTVLVFLLVVVWAVVLLRFGPRLFHAH